MIESKAIEESADYWRYDVGINVIPSDTKDKKPLVSWSEWQGKAIPEEVHNRWKTEGAYSNGIAVIPGKVWHREDKKGLYFIFIDADSKKAIKELLTRNGITASLQEVAKKWLVEQHADNPDKAHFYFYSPIPIPKKPADPTLGLEVKGLGEHGIAFCFPSIHRDGSPYEIIGTNQPEVLTDSQARQLVQHIDQISWKHGLLYLEKDSRIDSSLKNIVKTLKINLTVKIPQGQRHVTLITVADSLLFRHLGKKSEKELRNFLEQVNYHLCQPEPLPDSEIDNIWNSAIDFVSRNKEEQNAIRNRIDEVISFKKSLLGEREGEGEQGKNDNVNNQEDKPRKKQYFVQKYSEIGLLTEAVIVGGIPYFAVAKVNSENVVLEESIPIDDRSEYKPYEQSEYLNKPYSFKSKEDFESCIEKARKETLDTLYRKVKSIWLKYVDADDFHISICAADTIFTYYQDKIGLTHYLFFVGNNSSGKSNNLSVFHFLAYRNFTSTDITAANIYQFLGSREEGQGTLCEDEADRIDEDRQKMAIYKNGNITGRPVARTDTSFGRKQLKLNTYCWKAFAAEKFPDPVKAKGFNQRVIELQCSFGDPEQDIAEVANPAGEEEFQHLLDELNEMRNFLLAYRLLHFNEKIPDIKLNIKGREKQLFKPVLRVFQNTKTLNELLPVVSKYVAQKREANFSTFHAFLYRSIRDIIKDQDKTELASGFVWDYVKANLQGEDIHGKPLSYETPEFGVITQKEITQTLEHIFGAKPKKVNGIRTLVFDLTKLQRLGKVYDLETEIKVIREGEKDSSSKNLEADRSDWTDVGIGKYMSTGTNELKEIEETAVSEHETIPENRHADSTYSPHVSKATHPTLTFYQCYHKDCDFQTKDEPEYRRHWGQKHTGFPILYPTKSELEKYRLEPQGKDWEI